jgi:hypothetical protein
MNINAVSNLLLSGVERRNAVAAANPPRVSWSWPQDTPPTLSPRARLLSRLQQYQEQNPDQFKQIASSLAERLRKAAENAQSSGNTSRAERLTRIADLVQKAADEGKVPTLEDLQEAGLFTRRQNGNAFGYSTLSGTAEAGNIPSLAGDALMI